MAIVWDSSGQSKLEEAMPGGASLRECHRGVRGSNAGG